MANERLRPMNLPEVPLLAMLRERMTWLHQRQDVLSQNVANADTPNYVARDLKPLSYEDALGVTKPGAGMMTTNVRHIALTPSRTGQYEDHETPDIEASPNV